METTNTRWTIADEIAFFQKHGRLRHPIRGGDGTTPTTAPPVTTPAPPALPEGAELSADGKTMTINGVKYVVQSHVNALVGDARTDGHAKGKEEAEAQKTAAEQAATEADLKEQGKFKDLYEKEVTKRETAERERDTARTELASEKLTNLRSTVAAKHKIPADMADRLRGTDEASLEADAAILAKSIAPAAPVNTQTGAGGKGAGNQGAGNTGDNTQTGSGGNNGNGGEGGNNQGKPAKTYAFQKEGEVSW